jgi:hypothetical protein
MAHNGRGEPTSHEKILLNHTNLRTLQLFPTRAIEFEPHNYDTNESESLLVLELI